MSGIMSMLLGAKTAIAAAVDEFFNSVTLLLPGNGTNGAQNNTFLDSSSNAFSITRNGNTTQGTFSPFSQTGWSNYFNGTNSDGIEIPNNAVFNFGTSDVTIEAWVYLSSTSAIQNLIDCGPSGGSGFTSWTLDITASGYIRFGSYVSGTSQATEATSNPLSPNQWYHIAFTRASGTNRLFVNGSLCTATGTFTQAIDSGGNTVIVGRGKYSGFTRPTTGYYSNVRITKGGALYTAAFTPSTTPLTTTVSAGTVSLLTCQSNRFIDNSVNAFAVTVLATPSVQAFSPFLPTAAYSAATVGGSGYFDGSGDYLTGNAVLVTTTTANTFSIEGWFYPTSFANLIWLVGDMDAAGGTNNVAVDVSTGGAIELYWWDGAAKRCTSTTVMKINQWNYFAIVVNAGAISIYVNSTTAGQSGTTTLTNRSAASQNFSVGQYNNSTTPNGYIGSLRWSTSARTISEIPTAPYTSDANTRLLLNFTNAGITDATAKNDLETVGNAQISTTQSKFGGSSMYFDGTGDYLQLLSNQTLAIGGGDWTVEMWLYPNSVASLQGLLSFGSTAWRFFLNNSGLWFLNGGGSIVQTSQSIIATGQWYHVAVSKSGTSVKIFLNGTQVGSTGTDSNTYAAAIAYIGSEGAGSYLNGYIDDLRITKGYARYTSNFTAPTEAFALQ